MMMMMVSNGFNFPPNGYYNYNPPYNTGMPNNPQIPMRNLQNQPFNPLTFARTGYQPAVFYGQPFFNNQSYKQDGNPPFPNLQSLAFQQPYRFYNSPSRSNGMPPPSIQGLPMQQLNGAGMFGIGT